MSELLSGLEVLVGITFQMMIFYGTANEVTVQV